MSHRRTKVTDLSKEDEIGSRKRPLEILSDDDEASPSRARVRKVVECSDERGTYLDLIYVDVERPDSASKSLKPVEKPMLPSTPSMPRASEPAVQPMKDPETEDIGATNAFLEQVNRQLDAVEERNAKTQSFEEDEVEMEVVAEAEDGAGASASRVTNDTEPVKSVLFTDAAEDPFIDTDARSVATSATATTDATAGTTSRTTNRTTTPHPAAPSKVVLIEPQSGVTIGIGIGKDHVYTAGYLGVGGYNGREYWVYHYITDIVARKRFGVHKYAVVNVCDVYLKGCDVDVCDFSGVDGSGGVSRVSGDDGVSGDTPAPSTPPSTTPSTTPSTSPSSDSSDTDTTLPTATYTVTYTPTIKKDRPYTSAVAMQRILSGYKSLTSLSDKLLRQRNIDPGAFRALILAQTKLAGAMRDMLC